MNLAKKILTGVLSGAFIFQFVPMVSANNYVSKLKIIRSNSAEGESLDSRKIDNLRVQIKGMLKTAGVCVSLIKRVGVSADCKKEVMDRFFSDIVAAFSHVFDEAVKPALDDINECNDAKSLNLGHDSFVPTFLKDTNLSIEEKEIHLNEFVKSLEPKLSSDKKLPKVVNEYLENHPKFFGDISKCVGHYSRKLANIEKKLVALESTIKGRNSKVKMVIFPSAEEFVTSGNNSKNDSESSKVFTVNYGDSTDSKELNKREESKINENVAEKVNPSKEDNTGVSEKSDNFMVRFLRFISFGLLFKK